MPLQSAITGSPLLDPRAWISSLSSTGVTADVLAAQHVREDLLHRLRVVGDGRSDQGRAHPVAAVLALSACAVVAGMRSFTAIAGWVADVEQQVLDLLYAPFAHSGGQVAAPSKPTIWRVLTGVDGDVLDAVIGSWLQAQAAYRYPQASIDADGRGVLVGLHVDGKTVRGAKDTHGGQVHLLAAMTSATGLVVAQTEVGLKTNEIPMFGVLLDTLPIAGTLITADTLHTQRAHAEYLHQRDADFIFCVKENQPKLFGALDALPGPITYRHSDRGHGRVTTRIIQVLPAPPDLPFPHVNQVFLLERHVTDVRHRPVEHRRTRHCQPRRQRRRPRNDRPLRPTPLAHRSTPLDPRHPLPRRQLHRPHQIRTQNHGIAEKPRHRSNPPGRTRRHHPNHPLGITPTTPTIRPARPHNMILKRPWVAAAPQRHRDLLGSLGSGGRPVYPRRSVPPSTTSTAMAWWPARSCGARPASRSTTPLRSG